ncbi:MAG: hypothetical protein QXU12_05655 [Nitrososphaerota archaeon]
MLGKEILSPLMLLGIMLMMVGAILLILPLIARMGIRLEEVHPLILLGKRFDGVYIGTSPLLIIIMAALYIAFLLLRRG